MSSVRVQSLSSSESDGIVSIIESNQIIFFIDESLVTINSLLCIFTVWLYFIAYDIGALVLIIFTE